MTVALEDIISGEWRRALYSEAAAFYVGDYAETLIDLALNRLNNGDVRYTRHGWRVALRADLGDGRIAADAYWPDKGCRCRAKKTRGECSHELAAVIADQADDMMQDFLKEYAR